MRAPDHDTLRDWLQLDLDGELQAADAAVLRRHLTACPACRRERRELGRMAALLEEFRLPARAGFRDEVMARLPATGWRSRHPRSWGAAAALLVALLGGATVLAGAGGVSSLPLVGAQAAVVDLFRSSLLAGAGLLTASWRGLGLALGRLLDGSLANLGVFAVAVVGLNVLFLRLLLATRRAVESAGAAARAAERPPRRPDSGAA